jgi:hypothetical protein
MLDRFGERVCHRVYFVNLKERLLALIPQLLLEITLYLLHLRMLPQLSLYLKCLGSLGVTSNLTALNTSLLGFRSILCALIGDSLNQIPPCLLQGVLRALELTILLHKNMVADCIVGGGLVLAQLKDEAVFVLDGVHLRFEVVREFLYIEGLVVP